MILGLLVTIILLGVLFCHYKKGIIWTAMTLQFLSYLGTGIEGLKIFNIVGAAAIPLYFINKKRLSSVPYPLPLVYASLFFVFSFVITLFYSGWMNYTTVVSNIITYFIFPFLLWKSLKTQKEINLAVDVFYFMMVFAVFWGIIELITRHNIIFEAIESLFVLEDFTIDASTVRYGMKRCNSIFSYFSTYGVTAFIALIVFFVKGRWLSDKRHNYILLAVFCVVAALSTGSRAIYLGLFCAILFLFFDKKFFSSKSGKKILIVVLLLSPIIFVGISQIVDSIVNSDNSRYASGSSSEMRLLQWAACESYFEASPWFGNGRMYIWDVVRPKHPELLGAESIWFSIMVDYGICGAFVFLFLIYSCCRCLFQYNKRLICLPVGYLLILSLSPDQGIQYNLLITSTILIVRMYQLRLCGETV